MPEESVKLFISYSHRDENLRRQLDTHLAPLKRQKVIEAWHDRQIQAGMNWANQIDDNLKKADIILLLVSPDFVASDYCSNIELELAMKLHNEGKTIVVPVILEPCDWSWLPFAKFQAFPKDAKAITTWANQNEAFLDVATGVRKVAQKLFAQHQQKLQQNKAHQEEYKEKVEIALSLSTDRKISVADRDTLDELRESLGLTKGEADQIEDRAYKPFKDKAEKQERYKRTLLKYIENGDYPFSDGIKRQLEIRQRDLGIKTEDIEQITRPILAEAEAKYQEKLIKASSINPPSDLLLNVSNDDPLEDLLIKFLCAYSYGHWFFNAQRIHQWGAEQEGFKALENYSSQMIYMKLEQLHSRNLLRTKLSEKGNKLFAIKGNICNELRLLRR